jgi:hypothetical protein
VARLGSDKARIAVWKGFKVIHQILLALARKRRIFFMPCTLQASLRFGHKKNPALAFGECRIW